jgi:hypothetical protein
LKSRNREESECSLQARLPLVCESNKGKQDIYVVLSLGIYEGERTCQASWELKALHHLLLRFLAKIIK